jgi:hypothetical protein
MKTNQERLFDLDCRINDARARIHGAEMRADKMQTDALKKALLVMEEYRELLMSLESNPTTAD